MHLKPLGVDAMGLDDQQSEGGRISPVAEEVGSTSSTSTTGECEGEDEGGGDTTSSAGSVPEQPAAASHAEQPGAFSVQGQTVEQRTSGFITPYAEDQDSVRTDMYTVDLPPPAEPPQVEDAADYYAVDNAEVVGNEVVETQLEASLVRDDLESVVNARVRDIIAQSTVHAEHVAPTENGIEEHVRSEDNELDEIEGPAVSSRKNFWCKSVVLVSVAFVVVAIVLGVTLPSVLNTSSTPETWQQLGQDVDGEDVSDEFGEAVVLSGDGLAFAAGGRLHDGNDNDDSGLVRAYQFSSASSSWIQMGQDLIGGTAGDLFGHSVSLSNNASVLAAGGTAETSNGTGFVRVYQYSTDSSAWTQFGQELNGTFNGDQFGFSTSLSSDGSIVAAGAPGNYSGYARVFQYDSAMSEWSQRGQDLVGEASGDLFGSSLDLSNDGDTLAVGAWNNAGNGFEAGHVRVYQYSSSTLAWEQIGNDIDGEAAEDVSGRSVSLSSDGKILAVGAYRNDGIDSAAGHVRVFRFDTVLGDWEQLGDDIDGEAGGDRFGNAVSLSGDATTLCVGAPGNDGNKINSGHVRVFQYDEEASTWIQIGEDIDGEASGDWLGRSVSLANDGSSMAIGAPRNNDNGEFSGHVRVYKIS